MKLIDWIILIGVFAMLYAAFRVRRSNRKKGKLGCCSSCNGACQCCHKAQNQ